MEKEDWYFIITVLLWIVERIEKHIEDKEKTPNTKRRKRK